MFCSQEKFASCFTKIKERNPDEFKSITEQLMEHLQNNIEVQLLWPRYNKFPPVVWHGRDVENVGTLGFVCYLRALDEVLQVPPPPSKEQKDQSAGMMPPHPLVIPVFSLPPQKYTNFHLNSQQSLRSYFWNPFGKSQYGRRRRGGMALYHS